MRTAHEAPRVPRPAEVCRALLAALEAAEGHRRRRKRDQTPDAFGLGIKRALLERIVEEDPAPEAFEAWLLQYPFTCVSRELTGPIRAMARAVLTTGGWRTPRANSGAGSSRARRPTMRAESGKRPRNWRTVSFTAAGADLCCQ
jgi:hypothetical protein